MLRDPPPLPQWQGILYPYTGVVWASVGGVVILATLVYYCASIRELRLSPIESFMIVLQSLMNQSVSQEPRVWVSRGLLGLWLLATWVLRVSYTCNLMAFLTVPVLQPPLTKLEQLAEADLRNDEWPRALPDLNVCEHWGRYSNTQLNPSILNTRVKLLTALTNVLEEMKFNRDLFVSLGIPIGDSLVGRWLCMLDYGEFVPEALATSTHPILARLGTKLDLVPTDGSLTYEGEEHCVEMVVAGTHAHVETYSYLRMLFRDLGHHNVYTLREQLYLGNLAFFFTKNTPWEYKFDVGMRRLVEAGLVWQWYSEIMEEDRHSGKLRESRLPVLSLSHLQGPFLLLVVGGGLATITLLAERLLQPNTTSP
ncbi:hypothetical protein Pmani_006043 [Petrolisthes manimaculis]|nr:hypothetical protein Pmani_006043 [Petrolisthes manimaculis]